jgi:hypothetical protein
MWPESYFVLHSSSTLLLHRLHVLLLFMHIPPKIDYYAMETQRNVHYCYFTSRCNYLPDTYYNLQSGQNNSKEYPINPRLAPSTKMSVLLFDLSIEVPQSWSKH